ncbi:MAG: carboxypeptidase regulatory-like domain-containing protein [Kofleriaceae bacterium]|nr:carboxypeptidase regulatory-like domain-containing protein [Myxococcales bacterium]MCB9564610.1 carboxypeptidase regulatory-like domain-containing protein [Kofleriaceae bacterium]
MRKLHKVNRLLVAATLGASAFAGVGLIAIDDAHAQDATSGAISGVVTDQSTGDPLPGVTIVITGTTVASQTVITDENGYYKVSSLPPGGGYLVTFYYADITVERRGITVGINKTAPVYIKLDMNQAGGETIVVEDSAPTIDPTSTSQGITLDTEYLDKIPVPGRTFESALGAAAGSQGDGLGVAFSGSTSLENQYVVDGVNTTGLTYGTSGSPIINDFIEEIEVITGGYNAEYGRATGGVVNVVTKSGSNELAGSVWGYITPGFLIAARERTPTQATSIDAQTDTDYAFDFGFEVGGPIIKDKAWFWVGFAPQFGSATTTRTTKRRTDCRQVMSDGSLSTPADQRCPATIPDGFQDGVPDTDPATGFYIYEDLDTVKLKSKASAYSMLGKINFAVSPEHQGQVSVTVQPSSDNPFRTYGNVNEQQLQRSDLQTNAAVKWTSKFNDNKTEVEAVAGLFRDNFKFASAGHARDNMPLQVLYFGNLGTWSGLGYESTATRQGCTDNAGGDPYEFIENCPDIGVGYAIGGPGSLADDTEQRLSLRLSGVQRVKAMGTHEIKAGIDGEDNTVDNLRVYSGDAFLQNLLDRAEVQAYRWVKLGPDNADPALFPNTCRDRGLDEEHACDFLSAGDAASRVTGETVNWSAYLRDSWQLRPNFTINAGVRYEEQRLRYAKFLRNSDDPLTGEHLGTNAMVLQNMWAPRLGVLYDWTKEGRSKIYAHWGRFYESIPLDINDRSFGGEVLYQQYFDAGSQCGGANPGIGGADGNGCLVDENQVPANNEVLFGSGVLVAPGIKPQYMDEVIFGVEYEVLEDLKIGLAYQNRKLGRVIEDVSTDGAQTYIIANPGEWSQDEEAALTGDYDRAKAACDGGDQAACDESTKLFDQLEQFKGIRIFDKPRRDYNALQMTVTRRFSKALYMQGSYTYSRAEGNFPGLISYDNGQVDPNISSQYDLIELLANRDGPLPQDRPHYIKLDGYYTFDFKKAGQATAGIRFRALSGTPVNVLGRHFRYGTGESFILPRGSIRRTDFDTGLDIHADYGRDLGKGVKIELFADLFSVFNTQGTFSVDENYTYLSNINPIVGGTYEDLVFAKQLDQGNGSETSSPVIRNPNFGNVAGRYSPFSARFGVRMSF